MGVRTLIAACAAAMACACAAPVDAGVIFSSIPDLNAAPVGDWDATTPYGIFGSFTLTDAETIRAIEFVADQSTSPAFTGISIFSDDSGQVGQIWVGENASGKYLSSSPAAHNTQLLYATINRITLGPGTYWLDLGSPSEGIMGFAGSGSMLQCSDYSKDCAPINQTMGFELFGDPAGDTPIGTVSVPEPAVWTMLLLGLFLLGGALRLSPRPWSSARGALAQ